MGISTEPIEEIDWFERYENPPCLNHQPINSDALEGAIRNTIQQEKVDRWALCGSVCSLPLWPYTATTGPLVDKCLNVHDVFVHTQRPVVIVEL